MRTNFYPVYCIVMVGLMGAFLPCSTLLAQGCSGLGSLTLQVVSAPTPTLSAPARLCANDNGTVAVNETFSSYAWNTGQSDQSIAISSPGLYAVTVTSAAGCTSTAMVTVGVSAAPAPIINPNVSTCTGNVTLNAGPGFATYEWSDGGGTNQTATYPNAGQYTVTVTNAQGCTGTDSYFANVPVPPVVSINGDNSFCDGQAAALSATAGFSNYVWSNGQQGQDISVNNGGAYTVTITDAFGCTATDNFTVSELPAPQPLIVGPASICANMTATLTANAGFLSYSWSDGESTPSITVGTADTYTVTVTNAQGCTGTDTQVLSLLPAPNVSITPAPYACNNQLALNAGAGFSSYVWSSGGNSQTITVTTSNTYFVTVTNAQGCTGTDAYFADIPVPPVVSITGNSSFCDGTTATLSATAGFSNYIWSSGQNSQNISTTNGGTYTLTVTDAVGCTATSSFTVNKLPAPQPVIAGPVGFCIDRMATLTVTTSFPTYSWSSGQSTPGITVNAAGNYTVTVTDANGCTGTGTKALSFYPTPFLSITAAPYACNNQLTLSAGAGFNHYLWSDGSSNPTLTVNTSGTYLVTITNAEGCTDSGPYFATVPALPVANITGNNTICPGSSTTLTATSGFSSYLWSNNASTAAITVSAAGNYLVTVTDAQGCTATNSLSVSLLAAPAPDISGPAQICATGSATFSVPGTFSTYAWSTGVTTPSITVNTAATYTVTVTAANGCTGTDSQNLIIANSLQPQIAQLPYACNGQITLDAGVGFNTYNWGGGQNTQHINVTANGNYNVTVSDAGGCTGTAVITVTIPQAPTVTITGNTSICAGTSTTLNATAGWTAYTWSNGQVGTSISATTAGTYGVTATDAFGCTVADDFSLVTTPLPQPSINGPSIICINSSGTLGLNSSFSQYNWSTGASTASITITSGNTYTVTVTDAQGCTNTDTQLVTEATGLSPTVTQLPYACNGAQTLDAGAGFATYLWSGGQNTATISVTSGGNYAVTVTDATGCTGTSSLAVTIPNAPQVAVVGQNSFCQNSETTLTATSGFATYNWNNSATTNTLTVNTSGTFTVTVTDNLGCTATTSMTVTTQPLPVPQITGPAAVCAGSQATFALAQSFASYAWSDGSTGANITATVADVYSVTVTDANGCTGTDDTALTINPNPAATIQEETYTCNGQITLTAPAGFTTYAWTGPNGFVANNLQPSISLSGTYNLLVTDINGCMGSATQAVIVPAVTQVALSGPTQFCSGGSVELMASSGFTTYIWSNGLTLPNITATTIGTYTVTATDALGCSSTATIAVTNFPNPAPVIAGPQSVCPGSTATLSVGGNFTTYNWDSGANTASITLQPPFTATVTVTDGNGCTASATASVIVSNQLSPSIVELPYACDGQITLDAGSGFQNYTWSGGQNTNQVNVTQSGTYMVTVSDGSGCSGTATVQVTLPVLPQVTLSGDTQLCPAEVSTLTATSGFGTYIWSNGSNLPTLEVNAAGMYRVTVTDGLGCTATANITVAALAPPVPTITGPSTICGSNPISLNVNGGSFSSILWSNAAATPNTTVNAAGNYSVTVTDTNGCTGTAQTVIQPGGSLSVNISQLSYACNGQLSLEASAGFANYSWSNGGNLQTINISQSGTYSVTVTSADGCSGVATLPITIPANPVVAISGVLTFCAGSTTTLSVAATFSTYAWSNGSSQPSAVISQPGTYTVTVTNANGCTATASTVVQTTSLSPALHSNEVFCQGNSLTINVLNAYASYLWSDGSSQSSLQVTQPGLYTVTVTDAAGCTGTASSQVLAVPPATVTIAGGGIICGTNSTTLTTSGSVGTFVWSNGNSGTPLLVSQAGTYTVTVTDPNGCTATDVATVTAGTPVTTTLQRQTCRPAEVGTQTMTLTAANGCDSVVTIITSYVLPPGLALDLTPVIEAKAGQEVILNVMGNFPIDSVSFSSPLPLSCSNCLHPVLTATVPASILVMAFDANGCGATQEIQLLVRKEPAIYVPNVIQPGSIENSYFAVFSDAEITAVRNFNVFDRWGNAMFSRAEMPTNDPTAGWDGTFRNKVMEPGVYVYYFEVLLADGSIKVYKGDVTVL